MRGPGKTGHLRGDEMNIIEAREAAMTGKTVINCRDGTEWRAIDFKSCKSLWPESVFGEWRVKRGPRSVWINEYPTHLSDGYESKEDADLNAQEGRIACVKFIEVVE